MVLEDKVSEHTLSQQKISERNILVLDEHTLKDLEIFSTDAEGQTLFEFCNLTQTKGGAQILKRRMQRPWSDADCIRRTQHSVSFILSARSVFDNLPSAFLAGRAEYYAQEVMPIIAEENQLEFCLGVLDLWANHSSHYGSIVRGVQFTSALIRALRKFSNQPELASPEGELAPLVNEMRVLLERSGIKKVPDHDVGSWAFRILRLDQVFRVREKSTMARLLQIVYEMDALVSMADVTKQHSFVLPKIEEGPLSVHAEGLIHPFLDKPVANPVELDQTQRVLFLTGPNMAGKTTYLRAIATALYLGHLGMGVPASAMSFVPAERLFSSLSLSDDLRSGISYFRAEALRAKAVAQAIADGYRVVALMDEPFKGTNVKDALDASLAILERFATKPDCLFMFSSHLIELSEQLSNKDQIDCRYFEAEEGEGRLSFDYLLREGVSNQRLGMRVLEEEGVFELLDRSVADK
ncbi:MAG: DNA mismatch repair protein MutS [Planctomycetaceae bacterium]|jgi:DNA mismatch repair protein MutS